MSTKKHRIFLSDLVMDDDHIYKDMPSVTIQGHNLSDAMFDQLKIINITIRQQVINGTFDDWIERMKRESC